VTEGNAIEMTVTEGIDLEPVKRVDRDVDNESETKVDVVPQDDLITTVAAQETPDVFRKRELAEVPIFKIF
jgi:hypothetical protein